MWLSLLPILLPLVLIAGGSIANSLAKEAANQGLAAPAWAGAGHSNWNRGGRRGAGAFIFHGFCIQPFFATGASASACRSACRSAFTRAFREAQC